MSIPRRRPLQALFLVLILAAERAPLTFSLRR